MGMKIVKNPGTYLGIPAMWGENKGECNEILEGNGAREATTLETTSFVIRGNEILIKIVACAIPTYIMGYFKVSKKKVCE